MLVYRLSLSLHTLCMVAMNALASLPGPSLPDNWISTKVSMYWLKFCYSHTAFQANGQIQARN